MNISAQTVDARGLTCPMPVLRTKQAMDTLQSGQALELLATDRGAGRDLRAWVDLTGHEMLDSREVDGVFRFIIRKR